MNRVQYVGNHMDGVTFPLAARLEASVPAPTKVFSSWQNALAFRRRPRSCVVLLTHTLAPMVLARLAELKAALAARLDVHLALASLRGEFDASPETVPVTRLEDAEIFLEAFGEKARSRRIAPGNTDLAMLAFWRRHPGYHHYWMIEFDVLFAAGPGCLVALDAATAADLLLLHTGRREPEATWPRWQSLVFGEPLPGAPPPARHDPLHHTSGLFPISRYSAPLMATLDWSYRRGWAGHHEALVPTIAVLNGLSVENLNPLAERVLGHALCEAGGFNHRECAPKVLDPRYAYHPIKTEQAAEELRRTLAAQA